MSSFEEISQSIAKLRDQIEAQSDQLDRLETELAQAQSRLEEEGQETTAVEIDLAAKLSANFTLGELLYSDRAERDEALRKAQLNPPSNVVTCLAYLAEQTLQPIRNALNYPIKINSGYRSPALNASINGSPSSQHCIGEAADCDLLPRFLAERRTARFRKEVDDAVQQRLGKTVREDVNANYYLFAYICLNLDELDVDQVIHEFGNRSGQPAWVHVSSSQRQSKRQILAVGTYTNRNYAVLGVDEALSYGV